MHATHCLVGCVLCLASIGVAATTSGESQDLGSPSHVAMGSGDARSAISTSGDAPDGEGNTSSDQTSSTSDPGIPLSGGSNPASPGAAPMHHAPAHHVGWQSLLPGSIQ